MIRRYLLAAALLAGCGQSSNFAPAVAQTAATATSTAQARSFSATLADGSELQTWLDQRGESLEGHALLRRGQDLQPFEVSGRAVGTNVALNLYPDDASLTTDALQFSGNVGQAGTLFDTGTEESQSVVLRENIETVRGRLLDGRPTQAAGPEVYTFRCNGAARKKGRRQTVNFSVQFTHYDRDRLTYVGTWSSDQPIGQDGASSGVAYGYSSGASRPAGSTDSFMTVVNLMPPTGYGAYLAYLSPADALGASSDLDPDSTLHLPGGEVFVTGKVFVSSRGL